MSSVELSTLKSGEAVRFSTDDGQQNQVSSTPTTTESRSSPRADLPRVTTSKSDSKLFPTSEHNIFVHLRHSSRGWRRYITSTSSNRSADVNREEAVEAKGRKTGSVFNILMIVFLIVGILTVAIYMEYALNHSLASNSLTMVNETNDKITELIISLLDRPVMVLTTLLSALRGPLDLGYPSNGQPDGVPTNEEDYVYSNLLGESHEGVTFVFVATDSGLFQGALRRHDLNYSAVVVKEWNSPYRIEYLVTEEGYRIPGAYPPSYLKDVPEEECGPPPKLARQEKKPLCDPEHERYYPELCEYYTSAGLYLAHGDDDYDEHGWLWVDNQCVLHQVYDHRERAFYVEERERTLYSDNDESVYRNIIWSEIYSDSSSNDLVVTALSSSHVTNETDTYDFIVMGVDVTLMYMSRIVQSTVQETSVDSLGMAFYAYWDTADTDVHVDLTRQGALWVATDDATLNTMTRYVYYVDQLTKSNGTHFYPWNAPTYIKETFNQMYTWTMQSRVFVDEVEQSRSNPEETFVLNGTVGYSTNLDDIVQDDCSYIIQARRAAKLPPLVMVSSVPRTMIFTYEDTAWVLTSLLIVFFALPPICVAWLLWKGQRVVLPALTRRSALVWAVGSFSATAVGLTYICWRHFGFSDIETLSDQLTLEITYHMQTALLPYFAYPLALVNLIGLWEFQAQPGQSQGDVAPPVFESLDVYVNVMATTFNSSYIPVRQVYMIDEEQQRLVGVKQYYPFDPARAVHGIAGDTMVLLEQQNFETGCLVETKALYGHADAFTVPDGTEVTDTWTVPTMQGDIVVYRTTEIVRKECAFDPREQQWYKEKVYEPPAVVYWSDVYYMDDRTYGISISRPVFHSATNTSAIVVVDVELTTMSDPLIEMSADNQAGLWMMERWFTSSGAETNGWLISASDGNVVRYEKNETARISAEDSPDDIIRIISEDLYRHQATCGAFRDCFIFSDKEFGYGQYYAKVTGVISSWAGSQVLVAVPLELIMSEVDAMLLTAVLVAIGVVLITAFFTSHFVSYLYVDADFGKSVSEISRGGMASGDQQALSYQTPGARGNSSITSSTLSQRSNRTTVQLTNHTVRTSTLASIATTSSEGASKDLEVDDLLSLEGSWREEQNLEAIKRLVSRVIGNRAAYYTNIRQLHTYLERTPIGRSVVWRGRGGGRPFEWVRPGNTTNTAAAEARAKRCIVDAYQGRNVLLMLDLERRREFRRLMMYQVVTSRWYMCYMLTLYISLLVVVTCLEAPGEIFEIGTIDEQMDVTLGLEGFLMLFVLFDLILYLYVFISNHTWQRVRRTCRKFLRLKPSYEDDDEDEDDDETKNTPEKFSSLVPLILWMVMACDWLIRVGGNRYTTGDFVEVALPLSAFLRPLLILARFEELRRVGRAMLRTIVNSKDVFILMVCYLTVSASMGMTLLSKVHENEDTQYGAYTEDLGKGFVSFWNSFLTMFIFVATGENYPDVVYPAADDSSVLKFFLIVMSFIGLFLLLSLIIAIFQDEFERNFRRLTRKRELQRVTGIVAAFVLLDNNGDCTLEPDEYTSFLVLHCASDLDFRCLGSVNLTLQDWVELCDAMHDLIDTGRPLHAKENAVLLVQRTWRRRRYLIKRKRASIVIQRTWRWIRWRRLYRENRAAIKIQRAWRQKQEFERHRSLDGSHPRRFYRRLSQGVADVATQIVGSFHYKRKKDDLAESLLGETSLSGIELAVGGRSVWGVEPISLFYQFRHSLKNQDTKAQIQNFLMNPTCKAISQIVVFSNIWAISLVSTSSTENVNQTSVDAFLFVLLILHIAEMVLKTYAFGWRNFWFRHLTPDPHQRSANRFDVVVVAITTVCYILSRISRGSFHYDSPSDRSRYVLTIPMLRIFSVLSACRRLVFGLFATLPGLFTILVLVFLIVMMFAVLGTMLFAGLFEQLPDDVYPYPGANFDSMHEAFATLYQLMMGEGWDDVMYAAVDARAKTNVTIFFLVYSVVVSLLFSNLFIGIVCNAYNNLDVIHDEDHSVIRYEVESRLYELRENQRQRAVLENGADLRRRVQAATRRRHRNEFPGE